MKDSKQSYDQKHWEITVARHARMKALLDGAQSDALKNFAREGIAECEKAYPQLREKQ